VAAAHVPFLVLFLGRTGSTFLVEALDAHPDVSAGYEAMVEGRGADAAQQLEYARAVFTRSGCRAVGFKTKLSDVRDQAGFVRLLQEVGARVVVLRRRNLVKLTISWFNSERIYESTGDWNIYAREDAVAEPLVVDLDVFDSRLRDVESRHRRLAAYADDAALPTLHIYYEDLLLDRRRTLDMTFAFLGVEPFAAEGRTRKATPDDLRLVVANFDELRERYEGTRFEAMFDEVAVEAPAAAPARG